MGARMSNENDLPQRDRWARLRFAIIGPLLAAPPAPGELRAALALLAARTWRHPFTGFDFRFGVSTLERWFYAAKRAADPVQALRNQVRRDIGRFPSLSTQAVQALTTQCHEHPGWSAYWQACQYTDQLGCAAYCMRSTSRIAVLTCWMPASARTLRRSTATGSRRSRRARMSQRSMVEAPKRTGSPLIGCCQVRAASALISARNAPFGGGAARSWPITEKRKCAQRWCGESCFDALMASRLRLK